MKRKKVIKYLKFPLLFGSKRTKEILQVNPTIQVIRTEPEEIAVSLYEYTPTDIKKSNYTNLDECLNLKDNGKISWMNIDGIRKDDLEKLSKDYSVHPLLIEDILSVGQRPKMDEIGNVLYCLLNMLYYNEVENKVESEQISIILGKNFVISIQENPQRDVFDLLRLRLNQPDSKIRRRGADYLLYSMLDLVVDNYFLVMDKLGVTIEMVEDEVIMKNEHYTLSHINNLRKELIILTRNLVPVRELIGRIIHSESPLINDRTIKYFKDINDHSIQAFDLSENYRYITTSIQDIYISNMHFKLNEVMKIMTMMTCLLAPAAVISSVFGMNFDNIPGAHLHLGFFAAISGMIVIPAIMLVIFRKRNII